MPNISGDTFLPHRGLEVDILNTSKLPIVNGQVFFATDTNRIYWDAEDSRHCAHDEGIGFVYGTVEDDDEIGEGVIGDDDVHLFPRSKIENNHYLIGDIIINMDGTFYRILEIQPEYCACEKMLVAGSGGGGGAGTGANDWLQVRTDESTGIKGFPSECAYGKGVRATFKISKASQGVYGTIYVTIKDNEGSINPRHVLQFSSVPVNKDYVVEIGSQYLNPGNNYIHVQAVVNTIQTNPITQDITCIDLILQPAKSWNPYTLKNPNDKVRFDYTVTDSKATNLSNREIDINITYTLDDGDNIVTDKISKISSSTMSTDITSLFDFADQGGHLLQVQATTDIGGTPIVIGEYTYGIGWYNYDSNQTPIIWSPYINTNELNYNAIIIEYMVYDPANPLNEAEVTFYINNEEQSTITVHYDDTATSYRKWVINNYIVKETNTFTISCRGIQKTFNVYINDNTELNLESVSSGCQLWLNAQGRSNNENLTKRAQWINKIAHPSSEITFGDIVLENFNWQNNGWMEELDGTSYLRVSNGAKVRIPIHALRSGQNRTFEFDVQLNNATDYSKLIEVVQTGTTTDEDGNEVPELESKVVAENAAIKYYYNNKGIMIGTQEAFFALGENSLTNVQYADGNRIKLSFVVDANGSLGTVYDKNGVDTKNPQKLIYTYLNGVLSGVLKINNTSDLGITNNSSEIIVSSDFCDVDIYSIRVYSTALSYANIAQNWVGDASTLTDRQWRYRNNVDLVIDDKLDYDKCISLKSTLIDAGFSESEASKAAIPVMVITTHEFDGYPSNGMCNNRLPYNKDDTQYVSVRYYDPNTPSQNFHAQNISIAVQGTSSQGYPRRNFKLKLGKSLKDLESYLPYKFQTWDGNESNKNIYLDEENLKGIKIGTHTIPETIFCLKADYMESSSTHNTALADLIGEISKETSYYNLAHPLVKDFRLKDQGYRTTIYGFPILLFHEDSIANTITYVGKYNFNIDKGATDTFGFTNNSLSDYYNDGAGIKQTPFRDIAECWEFTQNQAGFGKFGRMDNKKLLEATDSKSNKLLAPNHFEARYWHDDEDKADPGKVYTTGVNVEDGNNQLRDCFKNFAVMWDWVNSTNIDEVDKFPDTTLSNSNPKYFYTLSTSYDKSITYYSYKDNNYAPADIKIKPQLTYNRSEKEPNSSKVEISDEKIQSFATKIKEIEQIEEDIDFKGVYTFYKTEEKDDWYYISSTENEHKYYASEFGLDIPLTLEEKPGVEKTLCSFTLSFYAEGFNTSLYEKFTTDNARYRLCKFKTEFSKYFDRDYCLAYFVITELLLLYDSRQKNMMLASWGPREDGKNNENMPYVWYPIFYDMDTQLGINNSGQVYWDYDTDATPLGLNKDGDYTSIFSGNGSALWTNFAICFVDDIEKMYRALRKTAITQNSLEEWYNTKGCDKWTEIMKNIDADYKYLSPATTGFINQSGDWDQTETYYYCIQGDRKLNRTAFFRNRLNYLDSQWLAGPYEESSQTGTQIKMRYNANDKINTSDDDSEAFNANATFKLKSYLSQYLSVIYDETATIPEKYRQVDNPDGIEIKPFEYTIDQISNGVTLSQQLVYIRGPEYISDMGDLSLKYLNEFDCSPAIRLQKLQLGNDTEGYRNDGLDSFVIDSAEGSTNAKKLLQYLDISRLSKLTNPLDLGGCYKLNTLKALGTKISSVTLPKGNVLHTIYLPDTITSLEIFTPSVLKNILTERPNNTDPKGLYIENLTNKLEEQITDKTVNNISTFQIQDDTLGINSYKLLNYLYKVRDRMVQNNSNVTEGLRIKLTNVDWSPYKLVNIDDELNPALNYYIKVNNIAYESYKYTNNVAQWQKDVKDGLIYTLEDQNVFESYPIVDLNMFERFADDYNNKDIKEGTNYYFKSTEDSPNPNQKLPPVITGRIHIHNTDTIDEEMILNKLQSSDMLYKDLDITVDSYNPACRAHFIEYLDDGTMKNLGWQKASKESVDKVPIKYPGVSTPYRTHYDFIGWAIEENNSDKLRNLHSIVTDEILNGLNYYSNDELENLDLRDYQSDTLIIVALYKITQYKISYYENPNDREPLEIEIVNAGTRIKGNYKVPYKYDGDLALTRTYKFIGWSRTATDVNTIDITTITALRDMNFYARFEECNVYDNILKEEWLVPDRSTVTQNEVTVGIDENRNIRGKICFPKQLSVNNVKRNITKILDNSAGVVLNGFVGDRIIAIFFEGANDGTSVIREIGMRAFAECKNLIHCDFPSSLTAIKQQAFYQCHNLVFSDLSYVKSFGPRAFDYAGLYQDQPLDLKILATAGYDNLSNPYVFTSCGHKRIQIGNSTDLLTDQSPLMSLGGKLFGTDSAWTSDGRYPLQEINVYYKSSSLTEVRIKDKLNSLIYDPSQFDNVNFPTINCYGY